MRVELVPAMPEHVEAISANARQADIDELHAATGETPEVCMLRGLRVSARPQTGIVDGEVVCMFGVTPVSILGGVGTPWMVGSRAMDRLTVQKALLRESRAAFAAMRQEYPAALYNLVDERNAAAIRWLRWLGFEFGPVYPMGADQLPFHLFYWRN